MGGCCATCMGGPGEGDLVRILISDGAVRLAKTCPGERALSLKENAPLSFRSLLHASDSSSLSHFLSALFCSYLLSSTLRPLRLLRLPTHPRTRTRTFDSASVIPYRHGHADRPPLLIFCPGWLHPFCPPPVPPAHTRECPAPVHPRPAAQPRSALLG